MTKPLHLINTWENLQNIKSKLELESEKEKEIWKDLQKHSNEEEVDPEENYGSCYSLEAAYLRAHGENNRKLMSIHGEDDRTTLREWGDNPIDAFLGLIKMGAYPPPELLRLISESFEYYFAGQGKVTLEHVFFGREVPKSGNESGRRKNTNLYRNFSRALYFNKRKENQLSQVELAEKLIKQWKEYNFVDENFSTDPESFLVNWRRWKKSNK